METADEPETESEEKTPFHKNPKVQRYIDRQVRKALENNTQTTYGEPVKETTFTPSNTSTEPSPEWIMAYGDTDKSRKAWALNQSYLEKAVERARQEALNDFRNQIEQEKQAEKEFENFITNSLESIEDTYDVDITSNTASAKKTRNEYLELVKKLSPKDNEGNIISYADFGELS